MCVADCNADIRLFDVIVVTVDISEYRQVLIIIYMGWNFNSGNYLFTADTK